MLAPIAQAPYDRLQKDLTHDGSHLCQSMRKCGDELLTYVARGTGIQHDSIHLRHDVC